MLVKDLVEKLLDLDQDKKIGTMSIRSSRFKDDLEIELTKITKENCFATNQSDNESVYFLY